MMKAAVFDFDGTLTPSETPIFEILEKSGMEGGVTNPRFMELVGKLVAQEKIDLYEAIVRAILKTVSDAGFELTDKNIGLGARNRTYNRGVKEFLQVLNRAGIKLYILSSGAKAYLEQTEIAPLFTGIFASTLTYGKDGLANGIETVMSAEQKTEALRQIAREINGNEDDCQGIVYFGDGPTDAEAIEFVKNRNGKAVLVHSKQPTKDVIEMAERAQVDLLAAADYSEGSKIYNYILSQK